MSRSIDWNWHFTESFGLQFSCLTLPFLYVYVCVYNIMLKLRRGLAVPPLPWSSEGMLRQIQSNMNCPFCRREIVENTSGSIWDLEKYKNFQEKNGIFVSYCHFKYLE